MKGKAVSVHRVKTITTINGRRVAHSGAKISVFDNAFLYADGLFETFLAIGDQVVFLEEHLSRLYRGAKVMGLTPPVSRETLARWMNRTIALHPAHIKKLRMTITSGESPRWVGIQGKPQVILSAAPHTLPSRPYRVHVSDLHVDNKSVFRRIKTLNYAINATALKRAYALGCDDALLLNTNNEVAEITSANIFRVSKGVVYTPPLSSGCLAGVTREVVIDCSRSLGFKVIERPDRLRNLHAADELFLSSSLKLVLPIAKLVDGSRVTTFPSGPITKALRRDIRRMVDRH